MKSTPVKSALKTANGGTPLKVLLGGKTSFCSLHLPLWVLHPRACVLESLRPVSCYKVLLASSREHNKMLQGALKGSAKPEAKAPPATSTAPNVRCFLYCLFTQCPGSIVSTCRTKGLLQEKPTADLSLANFTLGPILGTGSFGRVSLGKLEATGVMCAIKALSKAHVVKNQQV